jgi:Flp pilus assembly protein TadG
MGRLARRSRATRERGSAVVEFALVFPVVVFLMFGLLDAGRLMISQGMLSYAMISGARIAAVSSTTSWNTVQTAAVAAAPILGIPQSAIHYTLNGGTQDSGFTTRTTGDIMRVYSTYNFRPAFLTVLGNRTLNASGQIVIQ